MERIHEEFVEKVNKIVLLKGKDILEIGCGDGNYSKQLATKSRLVMAIDSDKTSLDKAKRKNNTKNITYQEGSVLNLNFENESFDVVIFTLSLHHIPKDKMHRAIEEAVRVVKKYGKIIFLEPSKNGSFFDAEILFDACDGDEREEKIEAYKAIIESDILEVVSEFNDKTVFSFESKEDFIKSLDPKQNIEQLKFFLEKHNFILEAKRRINICNPIKTN